MLPSADEVLEVGCGAGFFTNFIKPKSYTGLEFNDKAIRLAQGKGLNVKKQFLQEHATENMEKYDVVCFFQVLEHVENPKEFLQDALKCLKKGGKLIFAVPAEDSFNGKAINAYLNMPPHHATRYPDRTMRKISELFNLQLLDIIYEPIQAIHKEFCIKVNLFKKIRKIFGMPHKSLDNGLFSNLLYVFVFIVSKIIKPFKNFKDIKGVSVIAIYQKIK